MCNDPYFSELTLAALATEAKRQAARASSMSLNSVLPSVEHLGIIVLFHVDASLVLDLGEFGGTFLIHAVLEVAAHSAVSFSDLTEDVRLVRLAIKGLL